jgi:hypothetical protein
MERERNEESRRKKKETDAKELSTTKSGFGENYGFATRPLPGRHSMG